MGRVVATATAVVLLTMVAVVFTAAMVASTPGGAPGYDSRTPVDCGQWDRVQAYQVSDAYLAGARVAVPCPTPTAVGR